ncbi:MAG: DMT family transporter [Comamonadaceae bacterium]|nr:DMT family transporter [Comamonadaceae bacterium]
MSIEPIARSQLWAGVGFALAAGLAWGLVFVAPVLLPDYTPAMLTFGRYLAFGLIALPLAWRDRRALAALSRSDWLEALKLAAVGNVLYYLALSSAIQFAGVPLPTVIIGTLPVVIAVCANLQNREIAWRRLLLPLLLIALGIACVNASELQRADGRAVTGAALGLGFVLALAAVVCWTWYPLRNAAWVQRHPDVGSGTWATAQGLATLPLAALGMAACLFAAQGANGADALGPRPMQYIGLMLAIGLLASWLGTLCWNQASRLLPTSLTGQLIVFETLAALAYGYWHRGELPQLWSAVGVLLLVAGVLVGARVFSRPSSV